MKFLSRSLPTVAAFAFTLLCGSPKSQAAKLTLDGAGSYKLGGYVSYFRNGTLQTGRYSNLGGDYYHRGVIGMNRITNHSTFNSRTLSFELWAMPYLGARQGTILMTRRMSPLYAGYYYPSTKLPGYAISLNVWRYPELNLWEYTHLGWKWRDSLVFRRRNLL